MGNCFKELSIDGREISYSITGDGPPIILLHPIGLDQTWWSEVAEAWQSDYRIVAVDQRGHGRSSKVESDVELQDLADDVAAVIAAEELGEVHLIGVSMGGMVAQHVALSHAHCLQSLVLCSTAASFPEIARAAMFGRGEIAVREGMQAVVPSTMERWFSPAGCSSDLAKRCSERLLANDVHSWAACWGAISRLHTLPRLGSIQVPTLVITGESDVSTPPSAAQVISNAIVGSDFVTVAKAHHLGVFENPKPFLNAFLSFFEKHAR